MLCSQTYGVYRLNPARYQIDYEARNPRISGMLQKVLVRGRREKIFVDAPPDGQYSYVVNPVLSLC